MQLKKAEEILYYHMKRTGLIGYTLQWLKPRKKFGKAGSCNWKKKIIYLQPMYVELNEEEEVTNTILHEIAHGLTPKHGHNKFWKRKAIEIGCNGERCYSDKVKRS